MGRAGDSATGRRSGDLLTGGHAVAEPRGSVGRGKGRLDIEHPVDRGQPEYALVHVPARLARTARIKLTAHLPANWPWHGAYQGLFEVTHRPPAPG
ncbi:hypothetical protein WBG99_19565 [Streptomyces sp. TG1A-60]|uniref:hypothetical protein n=1 Tax=Streptomyces sp. TG1A-60 TaxID=3129111 RepID=UPI0030D31BE5